MVPFFWSLDGYTFLYGFYSQEFDAHSYDQGLGDGESGDVG